jgi:transcription elongation factor GreA
MEESENLITLQGKLQLEEELHRLLTIELPALEASLSSAGDEAQISAEKEQKVFTENRVSSIQGKLKNAAVVDPAKINSDSVVFGSTVILENENRETLTLKIVGVDEANIRKDKISVRSHLAKLLMGKKNNDVVELNTPKGQMKYTVVELKFGD